MKPALSLLNIGIIPLLSLVFLTGCNPCQETLDKQTTEYQSESSKKQKHISQIETKNNELNQIIESQQQSSDEATQEHTKLKSHIVQQEKELQQRQERINEQEQELVKRQTNIDQQLSKLLEQESALKKSQLQASTLSTNLNKTEKKGVLLTQQVEVLNNTSNTQKQQITDHLKNEKHLQQLNTDLEQNLLEESIRLEQTVEENNLISSKLDAQQKIYEETLQAKIKLETKINELEEVLESTQEALVDRGIQLSQQEQKLALTVVDIEQIQQALVSKNKLLTSKDDLIQGLQIRLSEVTVSKDNVEQEAINIPSLYASSDPKVRAEVNALFTRLSVGQKRHVEISQKLAGTQDMLINTQEQVETSLKKISLLEEDKNKATLTITELTEQKNIADTDQIKHAELLSNTKEELQSQQLISKELEGKILEQQKMVETLQTDLHNDNNKIKTLTEELNHTTKTLVSNQDSLEKIKEELNAQVTISDNLHSKNKQEQEKFQVLQGQSNKSNNELKELSERFNTMQQKFVSSENSLLDIKQSGQDQLTFIEELQVTNKEQQDNIDRLNSEKEALSLKEQELTSNIQQLNADNQKKSEDIILLQENLDNNIQKLQTNESQFKEIDSALNDQLSEQKELSKQLNKQLEQQQQKLDNSQKQAKELEIQYSTLSDELNTLKQLEIQAKEADKKSQLIYHTVQKSETLSKISKQYYNDYELYPLIKKANNLSSDEIEAGQRLIIPKL